MTLVVLGAAVIHRVGAPAASLTHVHGIRPGAANVALLFVCGRLPLFLGAEFPGGGRALRRVRVPRALSAALRVHGHSRPADHPLIAVPFIALDALSPVDPEWFDENLLRPSLIALYLSQLIVFAAYPLYRRRPVDVALAAIAFALMAWGLWRLGTTPLS